MLFIGMFRILVTFIVIIIFWYIICLLFELPSFILPSPDLVAIALFNNFSEILNHSSITLLEILLSLFFGIVLGSFFAVLISLSERLKRWIMPLLLASQSIPVFALAPILVLWFGYGISSKVIIGTIIVFFPIASNFSDALNKIPKEYIHAGQTLGFSKLQIFNLIKLPNALPGLFSGIRVGACFAPIGAVVGEWIGGSQGLGSYMIYSNARLQIDNMFAALIILIVITISLYHLIDLILKKLIWWE
ncbi:MAG: ABC transporter permease [Alphaproteobacteria bacterium]|nr:MAG: ABC transporter permease [Alphaproteobacteria bacterium]